jgi:hypothetical protein
MSVPAMNPVVPVSKNERQGGFKIPESQPNQVLFGSDVAPPKPIAAKGCSDFDTVIYEAFNLVFRDEQFTGQDANFFNIFNGKLRQDHDTSDFLKATDMPRRKLLHAVLNSARIAFHICVEDFVEMEFDLPNRHEEL